MMVDVGTQDLAVKVIILTLFLVESVDSGT